MTGFAIGDAPSGEKTTLAGTEKFPISGSQYGLVSSIATYIRGLTETITGVKTFGSAGAVGRLKIAGTTSGSTVLDATAVASGTLTLPAATDTLVGKATTDVMTNKTLTTPVINSATGIGQSIYTIKAADETVNNSATLQNDDDFSFAIAASEKWLVELWIVVTSPSANSDYQFDFTFPASCEVRYGVTNNAASLLSWGHAAAAGATLGLAVASTAITIGSFNGTWGAKIEAIFSNSTNAGTIQYRWAQGTMTAENTVEKANSVMKRTRLA